MSVREGEGSEGRRKGETVYFSSCLDFHFGSFFVFIAIWYYYCRKKDGAVGVIFVAIIIMNIIVINIVLTVNDVGGTLVMFNVILVIFPFGYSCIFVHIFIHSCLKGI